jgi:hypothetical protein
MKHMFCNIQSHDLSAVHRADDLSGVHSCITIHDGSSVVFVKTVVYHDLGTLMPYPVNGKWEGRRNMGKRHKTRVNAKLAQVVKP